MRQILSALAVLATLALAQNFLAVSSAAPGPIDVSNVAATATAAAVPPVGSLALLFAGLTGLTVAGRRFEANEEG